MPEQPPEFEELIKRGLVATRKRIEREETYHQISEDACDRAFNILSYAFEVPGLWVETRELLLVMVPKMEMAGHREDWIPYLEEGAAISRKVGDTVGHGEVCLAIGYLELLQADYAKAESWFTHSLSSFREAENLRGQGQALNRLAVVQLNAQDYDSSLQLAKSALAMLPDDEPDQANSYYVLGSICSIEQNWAKAECYHRASLKIWTESEDPRRRAWSFSHLGAALRSQGRLTQAIEYYDQAIGLFKGIHDPANQAIVQMNLANVYIKQEETHKALEMLTPARTIFLKLGDRQNLARVTLNMGIAYSMLKEWAPARKHFHESIERWKQLGNIASLCNALDGLGETFLEEERYSEAGKVFNEGLESLQQLKNHPRYSTLRNMLAEHAKEAEERQKAR